MSPWEHPDDETHSDTCIDNFAVLPVSCPDNDARTFHPPFLSPADQAVNQACNRKHQCYTCWPGEGCKPVEQYKVGGVGNGGAH